MGHDATKVVLGSTRSSFRHVDNKAGTIKAGVVARQKSDGALSVAKADGDILGVSLGKDLSNIDRTAICRSGLGIPVLLTEGFTPILGAQVHINDTTGLADASGAGKTGVNAIYASGKLTGVQEDLTNADCALIDAPGGL